MSRSLARLAKIVVLVWVGLAVAPSVQASPAQQPVILVVGDSLSAGYGVAVDSTWVALLQKRLAAQGYGYRVVNASVSGDTTGAARTRLPRALELHHPAIVILELGGNDGLRGLPLRQVRENFQFLIERSRAAGAQVVLIGMRMPPNYGAAYAEGFHALYGELARGYGTPLVGFFLDGVALDENLMQADGIHPTADAQPRLLDNLWPALQQVLKK
ncbi:MAG TPA: arylesterase [Steroidobacteraceae bacterium]|nr:arylesterase [Steroidobacteraceae bacterium]